MERRTDKSRRSLYAEVTGRVIAELEQGRLPWVQPWDSAACGCTMPANAVTGRRYSGINVLILWAAVIEGGYASQRWLTYRQAESVGGQGRYFFIDIARDGIALYQSDDTDLPGPQPKTPAQALAMAREYFEDWFSKYESAVRGARRYLEDNEPNDAAFTLHQAVERAYHCVLLVCTFYTPHVHNLGFLRTQAERIDPRLIEVWPRETRAERARFEKLKDAYVKARYSKHYRITEDELAWLGERVEALGQVVETICAERIEELERGVRAA